MQLVSPELSSHMMEMVKKLADYSDYECLVLDMHEVSVIDFTSCRAIDEILEGIKLVGHHSFITGASTEVDSVLSKLKAKRHLVSNHQFDSRINALKEALGKLGG